MLAISFLIIGCSLLITPSEAQSDATVFLKTTDAVDVEELKKVDGVSSVYKVKPIFFWDCEGKGKELNQQWNYVVVGQGLKDAAAQDKLIADVGGLDFVEAHTGYRLNINPKLDAKILNDYIKKADPKNFVKRPMTPASPKPACSGIDLKEGERLKVISMNRGDKGKIAMKMGRDVFSTILPALKVSYNYMGQVSSSEAWDNFQVIDYNDVATWCEYIQSQWAKDVNKKYPGAIKGIGIALGVEV